MPASGQFGGEFYTPSSFKEVIFSLPESILLISALIALLPFIIHILRKSQMLKKICIRFFILYKNIKEYFNYRYIERITAEEFSRLIEKRRMRNNLSNAFLIMITIFLMAIILTKTIFLGVVTTQSMVPAIFPKELVLVEGLTKDIKNGDIIVFKKPGYKDIIIHRVYSIENGLIKTKGDNADIDPWTVRKEHVLGKVVMLFGKPAAGLKSIGFYFVPTRNPFAASDPSMKLLGNIITALRFYGPVIAIVLLFFMIITPPSRRKRYYGRFG